MQNKNPLSAEHRESPDGNESGAYFCMYEPEKTGQDTGQKGRKNIDYP